MGLTCDAAGVHVVDERPDVLELSFGHVGTADVLLDNNVAALGEAADLVGQVPGTAVAVSSHGIGVAYQHDGFRGDAGGACGRGGAAGGACGRGEFTRLVDGGVEAHPVAHRDEDLALGVVIWQPGLAQDHHSRGPTPARAICGDAPGGNPAGSLAPSGNTCKCPRRPVFWDVADIFGHF